MAAGELLGKPCDEEASYPGGYDTLSCFMLWKLGLALAGWVA